MLGDDTCYGEKSGGKGTSKCQAWPAPSSEKASLERWHLSRTLKEGGRERLYIENWEKSIPGRRSSKCKGPEGGMC